MKKRMTALALAMAMVATISVFAVTAEGNPLGAAASMTNGSAAYSEEAAKAAALEIFSGTAAAESAEEVFAAEEPEDEEPAEEPKPAPDAEGTLSFANLESRVRENNYNVLALGEQIAELESRDYEKRLNDVRKDVNQIARSQWNMLSPSTGNPLTDTVGSMIGAVAAQSMQSLYEQTRKEFDDIKDGKVQEDDAGKARQYRNAQNLVIMGAETLYILVKNLEENDAALTRQLAALDRSILAAKVSLKNGLVPELTVQQAENGRAQLVSGQETLRMNIETYRLQLEAMVGAELGEPLVLSALPKVTAAQLETMDLEKDLAHAKESSYSLYSTREQIKDLKDTYKDLKNAVGAYSSNFNLRELDAGVKAAEYGYEGTVQTFELNFRTLHAQVKDAAQVLDARRTALSNQEKSYVASALKYDQGTISANALADAKDELAAAKDDVSSAERDLLSKYRAYCWAAEYGIING